MCAIYDPERASVRWISGTRSRRITERMILAPEGAGTDDLGDMIKEDAWPHPRHTASSGIEMDRA